jgi:hypothetical protein
VIKITNGILIKITRISHKIILFIGCLLYIIGIIIWILAILRIIELTPFLIFLIIDITITVSMISIDYIVWRKVEKMKLD